MLDSLQPALRELLFTHGNIPRSEVDVRFETPSREWIASLTRPTVSFFLFDVQENTALRQSSPQTARGTTWAERRMPLRRFDVRYLVSVIASAVEDEHLLLWRTLAALLRYPQLPAELLPEEIRGMDPPLSARVGQTEESPRVLELWGSLDLAPRPSLMYTVTTGLDLEQVVRMPLVFTRTTRYIRTRDEPANELTYAIGGQVRDRKGNPLGTVKVRQEGSAAEWTETDIEGRFSLAGLAAGKAIILVERAEGQPHRFEVEIPSPSYELVLD